MTALRPAPSRPAAEARSAADALALAQLVREAVAAEVPRQALHLRLSRLAPTLRRGHHHRLLREALEPALRPLRSRLFELPNGDLVAIAPPGGRHLRDAEAVLAVVLGEDMLADSGLHALLDLPRDAAALLAAVEAALGPPPAAPLPALPPADFTPGDLASLEQVLHAASLARFLRPRPVCRLDRGAEAPEPAWEEWRLAWPELRAVIAPEADPAAAPWLARRLRRLLDRRLLAELMRPGERPGGAGPGPLGLCLAARTLGEAEFLRLDARLDPALRAATVLALPAEDALADAEGFAFARDFARARGYRLALDLPDPALVPALRPALSPEGGVELLRLAWSPALAALAPALPHGRVVLTGADQAAAIGWGWEAGVTLFEGRLLQPRR
ncbi:hypothetical protein [Roseicella sp. DB1501]|uniref:hypothetical protein n=1 Tax=Roseicella sp. DB1501 TaxID=2730925 RepID=UPI0014909F02|nr:hypothetical protein [Roseicella sp. DB1501]NOG70147.1 hypothetical protein [Roseicella sp. DB1501]